MPRTLTEAEFTALRDKVLAAAPDGLDETGFQRYVGPAMAQALGEAENTPAAPEGSAIGRFASNAWQVLNPVTAVEGAYQAVRHPINTYNSLVDASAQQFEKAAAIYDHPTHGQTWSDLSGIVGHGVAGVLPGIGPAAAEAGEQIGSGDVAGGLGRGTALAAVAAPRTTMSGLRALGRPVRAFVAEDVLPYAEGFAKQKLGMDPSAINLAATRMRLQAARSVERQQRVRARMVQAPPPDPNAMPFPSDPSYPRGGTAPPDAALQDAIRSRLAAPDPSDMPFPSEPGYPRGGTTPAPPPPPPDPLANPGRGVPGAVTDPAGWDPHASAYTPDEPPNTTSQAIPGLSMPQATYVPMPDALKGTYGDWGLKGANLVEGMRVNATNRAGGMGVHTVGRILTLTDGTQIITIAK